MRIAIIGAGLAGACVSRSIANLSNYLENFSDAPQVDKKNTYLKELVIYEKTGSVTDALSQSASGNPFAIIHPHLTINWEKWELNEIGLNISRKWISELNFALGNIVGNMCGIVRIPKNSIEASKWEKLIDQNKYGRFTTLNRKQIKKIIGKEVGYEFAIMEENFGWISPKSFVMSCLKDTRKKIGNRLKVVVNANVKKIHSDGFKKKLELGNFSDDISKGFSASFDVVILTTGSGSPEFLRLNDLIREPCISRNRIGRPKNIKKDEILQLVNGQLTSFKIKKNDINSLRLKNIVCKRGYLSPLINGKIYSGSTYDRVNDDCLVTLKKNLDINRDRFYEFVGSMDLIDSLENRRSKRCVSFDKLPLVGKPEVTSHNFFIFTALGSRGFTYAPMLSEFLAHNIFQPERIIKRKFNKNELSAFPFLMTESTKQKISQLIEFQRIYK